MASMRTETIITDSENLTSQQEKTIEELKKRLDELHLKAKTGERLADQMDEQRYAFDKLRKVELQNEKYKKKLEDVAELRKMLQTLEYQNVELLEKNLQLEDELRDSVSSKFILENYAAQIARIQEDTIIQRKDKQKLLDELDHTRQRLAEAEASSEHARIVQLEERARELETDRDSLLGIYVDGPDTRQKIRNGLKEPEHGSSEEDITHGIANDLDDAFNGTTTADLRVQIRRLQRELGSMKAKKESSLQVAEPESLLDNTKNADSSFQQRQKLALQARFEATTRDKSGLVHE